MIELSNKKYLIFEGGGGRGNAYLGSIQALEEAKVLPLNSTAFPDQTLQFSGVGGASAGAITAFMIALGLSVEDIEFESSKQKNKAQLFNGKGFEFFDFFAEDTPLPGLYRSIQLNKGETKIGFAYDGIYKDDQFDKKANEIRKLLVKDFGFEESIVSDIERKNLKKLRSKQIDVGQGFTITPLRKPDPYVKALYHAEFLVFMNTVGRLLKRKLENILKENPEDVMLRKIHSAFNDYVYNLLYDRGLFTGTKNREYYTNLVERYFKKYHASAWAQYNLIPGKEVTFDLFHKITGIDFRVTGTNMTANESLIFSKETTPDFPVVEAVQISMNIPGAFKPVHIKNNTGKRNPLTGLWADGGMLNNLPFRAFANEPGFQNSQVLGFNITGGPDPEYFDPYDPWFLKYPEYANYVKNHIRKTKELPPRIFPNDMQKINPVKPSGLMGNSLFSVFGYLLNTWLNHATLSQLTPEIIQNNIIEIFSYHITILDFTPDEDLRLFVVERAKEITKYRLGI